MRGQRAHAQPVRVQRARGKRLHGQLARRAADDASVLEAMQSLTTPEVRVLAVFASVHEAGVAQVEAALPQDADVVGAIR